MTHIVLYHSTMARAITSCHSLIIENTRTYSNWKENRDKYHDNWPLSRSFSFIAVIDGIPLHTESMQTAEGRFLIKNNKQQCNYAEQPNNIHGTAQRQSCSHRSIAPKTGASGRAIGTPNPAVGEYLHHRKHVYLYGSVRISWCVWEFALQADINQGDTALQAAWQDGILWQGGTGCLAQTK